MGFDVEPEDLDRLGDLSAGEQEVAEDVGQTLAGQPRRAAAQLVETAQPDLAPLLEEGMGQLAAGGSRVAVHRLLGPGRQGLVPGIGRLWKTLRRQRADGIS